LKEQAEAYLQYNVFILYNLDIFDLRDNEENNLMHITQCAINVDLFLKFPLYSNKTKLIQKLKEIMCCKNKDGQLPIESVIENDVPFRRFEKLLENDILHEQMHDGIE